MSRSAARGGARGAAVRPSRLLAAGVLALLALVPAAGPAAAHDDLLGSTPRQSQRLDRVPDEVELEFDQPALAGYSAVALTGPDGADLADGDVTEDDVFVRMPVERSRVPGEYVLAYRVVASDGHPVSGEITFTVTGSDDDGSHDDGSGDDHGGDDDGSDDDARAGDDDSATDDPTVASSGATPPPPAPSASQASPQPTAASAQEPTTIAGEALGTAGDTGGGPTAVALAGLALLAAGVVAVAWVARRRRRPSGHAG